MFYNKIINDTMSITVPALNDLIHVGSTENCRKRSRLIIQRTRKTSKTEFHRLLRNTGGMSSNIFLTDYTDTFISRYLMDLTKDLVEPGDWRTVDCVQVSNLTTVCLKT